MKQIFNSLLGIFLSLIFLLIITVGIAFKVFVWDIDILNYKFEEEQPTYCGGAIQPAYMPDITLRNGVTLNKTGENLFKNNCTSCHALNEVIVGPALLGVTRKRKKEWLHKFIRNPQYMIENGDTAAINVYKAFDQQLMPPFPFSKTELDSLLQYIDGYTTGVPDVLYPVE